MEKNLGAPCTWTKNIQKKNCVTVASLRAFHRIFVPSLEVEPTSRLHHSGEDMTVEKESRV
jgi:hypothetical protein